MHEDLRSQNVYATHAFSLCFSYFCSHGCTWESVKPKLSAIDYFKKIGRQELFISNDLT